jgi:hypothetical protein
MADPTKTAATAQETAAAAASTQATESPAGEKKPDGMSAADAALLKENMQMKSELKKFKAAQDKAESDKAKETGEYQKLSEKHAARAVALEKSIINAELRAVAAQSGIVDLDIVRLIDQSALTIGEDGSIAGAAEAIAALKLAKPWAFGAPVAPVVPGTAKPGSPVVGGFKTHEDWKAAPVAERVAWAQKHPEAYQTLAKAAMAPKPR